MRLRQHIFAAEHRSQRIGALHHPLKYAFHRRLKRLVSGHRMDGWLVVLFLRSLLCLRYANHQFSCRMEEKDTQCGAISFDVAEVRAVDLGGGNRHRTRAWQRGLDRTRDHVGDLACGIEEVFDADAFRWLHQHG